VRDLFIINNQGEKEGFSFKKVYRGIIRTGAPRSLAKEIAQSVEKEIYPGITTREIYRKIKKLLNQEMPRPGMIFSLKEAMKKLGPTGFPFERYVGEIFSRQGFEVKLNQHLCGYCLDYEIDFLAQKDNLLYIAECKYRNLSKSLIHSDTILAHQSLFLDLKKTLSADEKYKNFNFKSLLVTNNKFTKSTIKYAQCVGTELLGWNFPHNRGLEYIIGKNKFFPITIFPSLKKDLAGVLASKKMMLAEDILKINPQKFARQQKVSLTEINSLIKEAKILI